MAQSGGGSYQLLPAPDLWYNDVDGVRAGVRVRGQKPGTFEDGPHRLDLGIWLGTWFPDNPVSYSLSFTEPIPGISGFGSEASVELISSSRTGFQRHGAYFHKRWQQGFNESHYRELSVGGFAQQRFETEYLAFPQLWQNDWLYLANLRFDWKDQNGIGEYWVTTEVNGNVAGSFSSFLQATSELRQTIRLGDFFNLRTRLYLGAATEHTAPEYLFHRSLQSAHLWQEKGLTRAKGTIPTPWIRSGLFEVSGGAGLRGYTDQTIDLLDNGVRPAVNSIGAINLELQYPNPLDQAIQNIPVVGGLLTFRSYTFFDSGTSLGIVQREEQRVLSDAGLGFTMALNIPDYLGKPRGLVIRYDLPLWISNPSDGERLQFRQLIGIGAIISL